MSKERFPGDEHRQIYHAWREFPLAMRLTLTLGIMVGQLASAVVMVIAMITL